MKYDSYANGWAAQRHTDSVIYDTLWKTNKNNDVMMTLT